MITDHSDVIIVSNPLESSNSNKKEDLMAFTMDSQTGEIAGSNPPVVDIVCGMESTSITIVDEGTLTLFFNQFEQIVRIEFCYGKKS